jgi:hypothetical protein
LDADSRVEAAEFGGAKGESSAVAVSFCFDDGEAEPAACGGCARAALEAAHHPFTLGWRNAWAIVVDENLGTPVERGDLHRDVPAGPSMPGRVFEQVFDHAPESVSVTGNCWSGLRQLDVDGQVGVAGTGDVDSAVGDVTEIDLSATFNEAGFAAGETLQSVDESVHPLRLLGRDGERELLLIWARVRRAGDIEVGADALQRGA